MGTDLYIYAERRTENGWEQLDVEVPDDRDHYAFAVLANVKNGRSFEGCIISDPIKYIAEPRGIPDDISIQGYHGWHSWSWVMLRELIDFDLDVSIVERGFVPAKEAERCRLTGEPPTHWCSWTDQEGWEQVKWETPLYKAAGLLPKIIETLEPLGDPDDIRLVFSFVS